MWCRLSQIFSSISNGAQIKQDKTAKGFPITRIETISDGTIDYTKMGYANVFDIKKYSRNILENNDILMSHINSPSHVGKSAIYIKNNNTEVIIHGMNLLCLRPSKYIYPKYIHFFFLSALFKELISPYIKNAVNQASINIGNLNTICTPLPPLEEQQRIVKKIEQIFSQLDKIEQSIKA